jgi:probable HAF family extracellular repeat protein
MYDLGSLGNTTLGEGDSNALAISASGEIVGWTDDVIAGNDYDPRAFVIKSGYTIPAATGSADESLFTGPTGMVDIGVLAGDSYSEALSVNSSGIVVGWSGQDSAGDSAHAFIYDSSAGTPVMEDLNDYVTGLPAGWTLDWASGVNDAGQITGYADDGEGDTYGFLLTPSAAVPEPGLGMVVLAGAALVSLRRRRA